MQWSVNPHLIEDAKKEARVLLDGDEVIRSVPFGEQSDTIFVTADQDLVFGTDSFEVEGTTFYVGTKRT